MRVADIMIVDVLKVLPDTRFDTMLVEYGREDRSKLAYVVDKKDNLLGILSSFDLISRLSGGKFNRMFNAKRSLTDVFDQINKCQELSAQDLMLTKYFTLDPDDEVPIALDFIIEKRIQALPVVKNGELLGEVNRRSLLQGIASANWCQLRH